MHDVDPVILPLTSRGPEGAGSSALGLLAVDDAIVPRAIVPLVPLGAGRAAQVRLVEATFADGRRLHCVEKVFRPGLLTRVIYRLAFQSPFAYRWSEDAIRACFYRRRVAAAIVQAMLPHTRVARPLYVRWDAESEAFLLGTEFIRGRGVVPQATDPFMIRRWVARRFGRASRYAARPHEEAGELLGLMTELEALFHECGLTGSGWQVCKRAMVSTANLLHTPNGYVVVDLESGIPAVLVPKYVWAGIRLGGLPLFDDLDPARLRGWLESRRAELLEKLGHAALARLETDAERLIEHSANWKQGELALGRNKWRVLGQSFRERFKARCLEIWRRRRIIDDESAARIAPGRRIFSRLTFLLGLVPGTAGRTLQRLWANRPYRDKVRRIFRDGEFRRSELRSFVDRHTARWRECGRVAPTREFSGFNLSFALNGILASITPRSLHRWLADPAHRRNVIVRMWLVCVSGRFQSEYGRHLIRCWIRDWERSEQLAPTEGALLRRQLESNDMEEYVRCFGMHMGLKLLFPLVAPLKYGGGAALVTSGNLWFLFLLMLMPVCRSAITVWRMLSSRRPAADYIDAFMVGLLPVVGTLAFPVQMYAKHRELSAFLLRYHASQLGRWLPIYGGKDSRVELAAIKSVNLVAESLEVGLAGTAPLRRLSRGSDPADALPATIPISAGRRNRLADEQLELLAAREAAIRPLHELVAELSRASSEATPRAA